MARKPQDIIKNPYIASIIFELTKEEDNSSGISKKIGKAQSTIFEHLINLEKEKYILKSNTKRGAYIVNLSKINERFLQYIEDYLDSKVPNELICNKYLNFFLKEIILNYSKNIDINSISELFPRSLEILKKFDFDDDYYLQYEERISPELLHDEFITKNKDIELDQFQTLITIIQSVNTTENNLLPKIEISMNNFIKQNHGEK